MDCSRAQMILSVLALGLCLIGVCHAALPTCEKINDCSCRTPDGKEINIRSLGNQDGKTPRFGYEMASDGYLYAYNPCYTFTDTELCTDVVACQKSVDGSQQYPIGDVTATWNSDDNDYYTIQYTSVDIYITTRTSVVSLVCDASLDKPRLDRVGTIFPNSFFFALNSVCACPGLCDDGGPIAIGGISPGSVLCIIVSVLIIVYAVGGLLFMKVVRKAQGKEVIPNYEMWRSLYGYTRDGFIFVFSCGKKSEYISMK